jgi:hypothetical protein
MTESRCFDSGPKAHATKQPKIPSGPHAQATKQPKMPKNRIATSSKDIVRNSKDNRSQALTKFPKRSSTLETVLSGEAYSIKDVVSTPITVENDPSFSDTEIIFKGEGDVVNRGPGKGRKVIVLITVIILFLLIIIGVLAAVGDFKKDPPVEINNVNENDGNVVRKACVYVLFFSELSTDPTFS